MNKKLLKSEAQARADQIAAFRCELALLERDAALSLTAEQQSGISGYHSQLLDEYQQTFDIDRGHRSRQLSLGLKIASFLGALALAASLFFLFYQFWGTLNTPSQVTILITIALGSFMATAWCSSVDESGYYTKLVAMVSFASFVLNIIMLGQIFNITPSDNAFLVWAAYALLLAYAYDIRLLQVAGIICLVGFISARVGAWGGIYWIHFGERPENFIPAALLLFFLPQWINQQRHEGFAMAYRVCGAICLFIPILILSYWGSVSYFELDETLIEGFYQLLGFVLAAGMIWLGVRRAWNHVINCGISFFVLFLYSKLFSWWWDVMPKFLFFLLLGAVAVLCVMMLKRLRHAQLSAGDAA